MEAYYQLDGETVTSQRKWTMQRGTLTDAALPTYDWLLSDTTPDTQPPVADTEEPTQPDGIVDLPDVVTEPDGTATPSVTTEIDPDDKGCASVTTVSAGVLAAMLISVVAAGKKHKKEEDI